VSERRGAVLYAGGLLFQQAVAFATGVAVARAFGPQTWGEVSLARSLYAVAVILAPLGLDLSLLRHLGAAETPRSERLAEVGALRRLVRAASLGALTSAALAGPWLQAHLYRQPGFALSLLVSFLALPFAADLAVLNAQARAQGRVDAAAICCLYLQPVARSLALLLLVGGGAGGLGVLAATAIGVAAADVALAAALRASSGQGRGGRRVRLAALGPLLRTSGWMALMLLAYNGLKLMDVLVLAAVRPAREVGDYAALSAVAQLIGLYPAALGQTLAPTVAARHARDDPAGVREALRTYLRRAGLAAAPLFAAVAVFGPRLDLLFGTRFHFDGRLAVLLALNAYVGAVFGPLSVSLSMTGRHRLELAVLIVGGGASLAGCLLLAPRFGGLGVAGTTLAGALFVNIARAWLSARALGGTEISLRDVAAPSACLLLARLWRLAIEQRGAANLTGVVMAGCGFGLTAALLYATVLLTREERRSVLAFSRRPWRSAGAAAPCRS
jgi:O-antigen/teichoic acid export membrane protein